MTSRAHALRAIASIAFVVALPACERSAKSSAPSESSVHRGVEVREVFQHGADRSSPLVVALHGRGGNPDAFAARWDGIDETIELAIPRGFISFGWGYAWFDWPQGLTEEQLAGAVSAAADRLWPAIEEIAHGRRATIVGFSQGAVLAFALAARHPESVAYAFPIAGSLPRHLVPADCSAAHVYALHGAEDHLIPIFFGRSAVAAFKKCGGAAELHEFPGLGHTISPEMHDDVLAHLHAVLSAPLPRR
jgi:phospholipase/carboxylesterase